MKKTKVCTKCGKRKNLFEFYRDKYKKDGFHNPCKKCSDNKKAYSKNKKCPCCNKLISNKSIYCASCAKLGKRNGMYHRKHKKNCQCGACKQKRRELLGKKAIGYKHGKFCQDKHYYCPDCDKEITIFSGVYGGGRCKHCSRVYTYKFHPECSSFYGKKGSKSCNWQGGISFEKYGQGFDIYLKNKIRKRDYFVCQLCGIKEETYYRKLDVHHINYDKQDCKENNLIALCHKCNMQANTDRDYYFAYFMYVTKQEIEL